MLSKFHSKLVYTVSNELQLKENVNLPIRNLLIGLMIDFFKYNQCSGAVGKP